MAKEATKRAAKPGLATGHKMLILVILVVFTMVWPAIFTLLGAGMMPTIVAYLIDKTPQKHTAFAVGGMNFCGVFPYLLELWNMGAGMADVAEILTNVFSLLAISAAAAFGWLLYAAIPPVVTTAIGIVNQRKIAALRRRQKQIVAEWGDGVAGETDSLAAAAPETNDPQTAAA